jgi:hypothetical protein
MNNVGRPTRLFAGTGAVAETFTGNKALMLEEPLLFERGSLDTSGVDLPPVPPVSAAPPPPPPHPYPPLPPLPAIKPAPVADPCVDPPPVPP